MPVSPHSLREKRSKMPVSDRAKQFMSFAALSGLDVALAKKEWEIAEKQRLRDKVWQENAASYPENQSVDPSKQKDVKKARRSGPEVG
ncbi:hypothetical protein IJG78_00015 [Candidatus Saccharibacteria bacterium]|nr:hypothetical protein [Candidatus Saccharibacteria bacterium]